MIPNAALTDYCNRTESACFCAHNRSSAWSLNLHSNTDQAVLPRIGIAWAVLCVVIIHVLCVPIVFRYSRVIWAHLNVRTTP